YRQGVRLGAGRRRAVDGVDGGPGERARVHSQLAPPAPGSPRDARAGLPARSVHGARGAHPGAPPRGRRQPAAVTMAIEHTDTLTSSAVLAPFGGRGRALMLGHVHPDADVLGTLLGLGLALEGRGWRVTFGG